LTQFFEMTPVMQTLDAPLSVPEAEFAPVNDWVKDSGRDFVVINDLESLDPFFLSVVSASEQWFFCSSNGTLSAGRRSPDTALFPYLTVDKILENWNCTGPLTAIQCEGKLWHPFWPATAHAEPVKRRLLKSMLGEELVFDEFHQALGLRFTYRWQLSDEFGFVRKVKLVNESDEVRSLRLIDGLQDLQPSGVDSSLHLQLSCLADAYKMSELDCGGALMIHRLASGIVDAPIALECLKATTVWTAGFKDGHTFLSRGEAEKYLGDGRVNSADRSRGERGAFLLGGEMRLAPGESREWLMVAEIEQTHRQVAELISELGSPDKLIAKVENDLGRGRERLRELAASVDGFQVTADLDVAHYHYHNTLCNYLRGGLPENASTLGREPFRYFLEQNNRALLGSCREWLQALPETFTRSRLLAWVRELGNSEMLRLAEEYLPLILARRHGDPSRPWNKFNIRLKDDDGDPVHHFEGNWRDIFQNWEALAWSYPDFLDAFIHRFLNASTITGFNPYRVTSAGVDWEAPDEHDPWVSIGYWGDHQIVYLLKFLELKEKIAPEYFEGELGRQRYVFADVPYRFRSWQDILDDPRNTIEFDSEWHEVLMARKEKVGGDGLLLRDDSDELVQVSLLEKLLIPAVMKLGQLVPGGGIWMNTQKPEWNDANNALAGCGMSVVTTAYLLRYVQLVGRLLTKSAGEEFVISAELSELVSELAKSFSCAPWQDQEGLSAEVRFEVVSASGMALESYRNAAGKVPAQGSGMISREELLEFLGRATVALEGVLESNRRSDGLWHSYNVLDISKEEKTMGLRRLPVMLEGQVAILSSGLLNPVDALTVLETLPTSDLRSDRHPTYLLYPDRELARFSEMNRVKEVSVMNIPVLEKMASCGDGSLIFNDEAGDWRFRETLVNGYALAEALDTIENLPKEERRQIEDLYEEVFCHQSFTGRSGSMFGYEGLGCVYWHMVSKLMVASQEVAQQAFDSGLGVELKQRAVAAYYSVQRGLGFRQTPKQYGAFPAEPYSHSQGKRGAQQPGLTGQVKEGILCRLGELGIDFREGRLSFRPRLLRAAEFTNGEISFTYARTPVIYQVREDLQETIASVHPLNGVEQKFAGASLDLDTSARVVFEEGTIEKIVVQIPSLWLIS
jgi:hypothetical protein